MNSRRISFGSSDSSFAAWTSSSSSLMALVRRLGRRSFRHRPPGGGGDGSHFPPGYSVGSPSRRLGLAFDGVDARLQQLRRRQVALVLPEEAGEVVEQRI